MTCLGLPFLGLGEKRSVSNIAISGMGLPGGGPGGGTVLAGGCSFSITRIVALFKISVRGSLTRSGFKMRLIYLT